LQKQFRETGKKSGSMVPGGKEMVANMPYKFDFAISFSGPQRATASEIAAGLSAAGFAVFYDKDQAHQLLGEDGESYLRILFSTEARFYVVLISKDYDHGFWTQVELQAIRSRESMECSSVLIPVMVTGYRPKWLSSARIYYDLRQSGVRELIEILTKKASEIPMIEAEVRADPYGYHLMLSSAERCTFEYSRFVQEAKKRLGVSGFTVQDWDGPRSPELNPIVQCRPEDRLVALRVKAVIDTLLRQYGPLKGEVQGEVRIDLDGPPKDISLARTAVLYL
jgi:hypothetical protein